MLSSSKPSIVQALAVVVLGVSMATFVILSIVVAIRTELLDLDAPLSDASLSALLVVAVGGLTASTAAIGSLLTWSYQARTIALQADKETRESIVAATTVLELLQYGDESDSANPLVIGGVVSTLLKLGHTEVALGIAETAVLEEEMGAASTARMLSHLFDEDDSQIQIAAARLLNRSATRFVLENPPDFAWPDSAFGNWLVHMPDMARHAVLSSIARAFGSAERTRWRTQMSWGLNMVRLCLETDPDDSIRQGAATIGRCLLSNIESEMDTLLGPFEVDCTSLEELCANQLRGSEAEIPSGVLESISELEDRWGFPQHHSSEMGSRESP